MNDLIDDHEMQRLLDGVLPADELVLLLRHADENPANWRRIAMSFIEEQNVAKRIGRTHG